MIIQLKMKYWRQHIDRTIDFTSGLNAIRGANEAGKTSTMMAINYCLWGVKAVPLSLEDLVTWTYPVKNLKVEVIISVGGELYHFTRSKSGAECKHSGGVVTGQNEVTKFATELLKADADLASKLMFASQKGLNSLLETGTTALAGYIEDLAGMDLFDRLLDIISRKLVTGPTTSLDAAVAQLEATVEAGAPAAPDVSEINQQIAETEAQIKVRELLLTERKAIATAAADAYSDAKAKADMRSTLEGNFQRARDLHQRHTSELAQYNEEANLTVDRDRIPVLERAIADETLNAARYATYTKFSALQRPEDVWEGDMANLQAERTATLKKGVDLHRAITDAVSEIRVAQAKKVTASVCGFCNQDMSKFPAVSAKNAEIDQFVSAKEAELVTLREQHKESDDYFAALEGVIASNKSFEDFANRHHDMVEVDKNHVPWVLTWKGDVPQAAQDTKAMAVELADLKAKVRRIDVASVKVETLQQSLREDASNIMALEDQLRTLPTVTGLDTYRNHKEATEAEVRETETEIREMVAGIQQAETDKARLFAAHTLTLRAFEQAKADLAAKTAERDKLVFNNTLVKKVKAARPIVAAKLWSIVLASTSQMFSRLRGEASVVTKGTDNFLVNNYPIKGLSGSALDLLGLSLRVSLIKTFIPDCAMLALDEPMAASDDSRTASMLGFLSSCDFQQVLLVTHETVSESVANNLIEI